MFTPATHTRGSSRPSQWGVVRLLSALLVASSLRFGAPALNASTPGQPTVLAGNFTWAENLVCHDGTSSLFVSDTSRGRLWRVQKAAVQAAGSPYTQEVWVDGFTKIAGVATSATGDLYALAQQNDAKPRVCRLLRVNTTAAHSFTVVAELPPCLGDGLAIQESTGLAFVASEGDYVPGKSAVYQVDLANGNVATVMRGATGLDGAYIDQGRALLYVSQINLDVVTGRSLLHVFNLSVHGGGLPPHVATVTVEGVTALDDFTLSTGGDTLYGAGFLSNAVVSIPVGAIPSLPARPLHTKSGGGRSRPDALTLTAKSVYALKNPTSVRLACPWMLAGNASTPAIAVTQGNLGSKRDRGVYLFPAVSVP